MPFELNSTGLIIQTQAEILDEIKADLRAIYGNNLNLSPTSIFGQLANLMAEWRGAEQQKALQVYNSFDPNGASGAALDARAALTATRRRGETRSVVEGLVTLSGAATIPAGSTITLDSNGSTWELLAEVNEAAAGSYPATFRALAFGPLEAFSGSGWTLSTVIANWDSFTNPTNDAVPGRLLESDGRFRQRRNVELYSEGRGSLNSIAAVVSEVNTANGYVDRVRVYHNPATSPVDANGIPFKAFNVVVRTVPPLDPNETPANDPLQQDIADAILRTLGAGGEAFGTDFVLSAVDIEDQVQPIAFDEFADAEIWVLIVVETAAFVAPFDNLPVVPLSKQQMANIIIEHVVERANEEISEIGQAAFSFVIEAYVKELVDSQEIRGINSVEAGVANGVQPDVLVPISDVGIREIPNYSTGRIEIFLDGAYYTYNP